ncbi:MAG: glycosyltransferase [Planctomycetales bacterium]|nr:glycosyltransferase [Planctomycetales bacterium]
MAALSDMAMLSVQPLPTRPLRVLHVIHWLTRGGIESWLLNLLRHIDRSAIAMDVCCKGPDVGYLAPQVRASGAEVLHCPLGLRPDSFVRRLKRTIQSGGYHVVHVHTHVHSGLPVVAARAAGVPVVTTFHNSMHGPETSFSRLPGVRHARSLYARYSMRYALLNSTLSTGVSLDTIHSVERMAGLKASRASVSHLGVVDPPRLASEAVAALREDIGLEQGARAIVHVGSFSRRKNHPVLLRAFRLVLDAIPRARLVLVGEGPERAAIEALIQELRLTESVRVLGLRNDVHAVMQTAEVFLFPSITEGLSLALMEAHAVGLPVVASDIPGNVEACEGGTLAKLCKPHDAAGFAASAVGILNDKPLAVEMGARGRRYFESEFSMRASIDRLQTLYDQALRALSTGGTVDDWRAAA